jgi:hypothetical protein
MNKLDNPLDVTKSYDRTLKMFYSPIGISCYVLYNNGQILFWLVSSSSVFISGGA